MISDWRFRYQEFDELPYTFSPAANSVPVITVPYDYFKLTNSKAASLNTNHRLQVDGIFTKATVVDMTAAADMSTTFSTTFYLNEVVKVAGIGEASMAYEGQAAATGYTWIKVRRAYPSALPATGTAPAIATTMTLTLINSVARTNQRPNPPVTANGKYLENVVQITRESYGVGEHMAQGGGIKTLLMADGAAQLDLNYELVEQRLMKTIERAIVAGRRYAVESGNESEYETGGVIEFIPAANYINAGGVLTVSRVNTIISTALDTSGVRELYAFGGSTFTKNLAEAYENKRGFGENTQLSVNYGLKVNSIEGTGRDGIVHYVNAPILSEIGLDNQCIILNLNEYNYGEKSKYGCFQIAEKVPIKDLPEKADSYEENAGFKGLWRELYYAFGLVRRLQDTHFRVYGVTS